MRRSKPTRSINVLYNSIKVIVYKSCGELSLLMQCTSYPRWPARSFDFKKMKVWKKCPIGPNQPKFHIIFHQKSQPQDFIRRTLISISVLQRNPLWKKAALKTLPCLQQMQFKNDNTLFCTAKIFMRNTCKVIQLCKGDQLAVFARLSKKRKFIVHVTDTRKTVK